jgi:hypothetical protein
VARNAGPNQLEPAGHGRLGVLPLQQVIRPGQGGSRWLAAGAGLAVYGLRRKFTRVLVMTRTSARTRQAAGFLGLAGNVARGVVFGVAGVFLVVATASSGPDRAQGLDGPLRKIAPPPPGPWLLVAVALGFVILGIYSRCEARWRNVRPG